MTFPVELIMNPKTRGLILKVSSLPIFGGTNVPVPEKETQRLGFFNITYEHHYTVQEIEAELARTGKNNANAYREIRTRKVLLERPYREMQTTTFQSYHIPEKLARQERENGLELARSCTS